MATWYASEPEPVLPKRGAADGLRLVARGLVLGIIVFGGLLVLLLLRLFERPIFGQHRPITPYITCFVCRVAFVVLGIRFQVIGKPMLQPGAHVANHSSWLDIFALNATTPIYFVSKAEVAKWPGIGWLARATGTVFVNRRAQDASRQRDMVRERLRAGHRLVVFPEGTSTDGKRVLPFKSTLFASFFDAGLHDKMWVQPVTVQYTAPNGRDARFYGWWGDMEFGPHLLAVLAQAPQGSVAVTYHPPLRVADFPDRKSLSQTACNLVSLGMASAT